MVFPVVLYITLTLLLERRRKLGLAGGEVKVSVNVSRIIPDFQTPVSRAFERGINTRIGHREPQRVEVVYSIKLQVEKRARLHIGLDNSYSAAPLARFIYIYISNVYMGGLTARCCLTSTTLAAGYQRRRCSTYRSEN